MLENLSASAASRYEIHGCKHFKYYPDKFAFLDPINRLQSTVYIFVAQACKNIKV